MSKNCDGNCSTCKSKADGSCSTPGFESPNAMSTIKKVIAVVSGKGGVGKSLVTSLLAVETRRRGFEVAVMDADVTGPSIPKAFGITEKAKGDEQTIFPVETKTGIKTMSVNLLLDDDTEPVIWRGPVISGAVKQFWTDVLWGEVDCMFVDMPPGTGDVPLTVFQSIPLDGIIIVTSPQELVSMIVEKAVKMAKKMNVPVLGLIENYSYLSCPDCGKKIEVFGKSRAKEAAEEYGIELLAELPIDPRLAKACDDGLIELSETSGLARVADVVTAGL